MIVLVASAQVKPNAGGVFAEMFVQRLLPSLRAHEGFRDDMLLVVPGGPEILALTFWKSPADADAYERAAWPEVVKALADVVDRPALRRYQLAHSTLHAEGVAAFPIQSPITTEPTGVGA